MNAPNEQTKKTTPRKPRHLKHVRISLTVPPAIHELANQVLIKYKYSGYSEYFAARVRKDGDVDIAA